MASARELAALYDRSLAALHRAGGDGVAAFLLWLVDFWDEELAEPAAPPTAVSLSTPTGDGVRWYESAGVVLGCVGGDPAGCYRIPTTAEPPVIAPAAPTLLASPRRAAGETRVRAAPWRQYGARR
jgi:hypothetical protein